MRAGKIRRGYSLIELVVASALFLYLTTLVSVALYYCNQYLRNAETKTEAQTQALAASVWLSRSLTESNVTAMTAQASAGIYAVSFPSPRDPGTGGVSWSGGATATASGSGAMIWKQMMYAFLTPPDVNGNSNLAMNAFPLKEPLAGGIWSGTSSVMTTGFPPFPVGAADLPSLGVIPTLTTGMGTSTILRRTIAQHIRQLTVDIYSTEPGNPQAAFTAANPKYYNTANITLQGFAPYYGLNYGVNVKTQVRIQN